MKFMMYLSRRLTMAFTLVALGLTAPVHNAHAVIGTVDAVPAATLLLPHFEVHLDQGITLTTLFTVTNTSASPVDAHVVLWTNTGVPTLSFDIALVAKDVVSINVEDIFNGSIVGGITLSQAQVNALQAKHTGQPYDDGGGVDCYGINFGDNVARGYITIDTWSGTLTPLDAGYFTQYPSNDAGYFAAGGTGKATNTNVLWGDYSFIDLSNNFGQGDTMVHIEADETDTRLTTSGNYTFYGRFVGLTARDNREPLTHKWNIPYNVNPDNSGFTSIIFWRDSAIVQSEFPCAVLPLPYPLTQNSLVYYDDDADSTDSFSSGFAAVPFPYESGRVSVGGPGLPVPYTSGWIEFDSRTTIFGGAYGDDRSQSFITVIRGDSGIFSSGHEATHVESAIAP